MKDAIHSAPASSKALALYALITLSVVLATADGHGPFKLAALIVGQALALTLAHGYAESAAHQTSLWSGISHATPILLVAVPSLLITLTSGFTGVEGESAVYIAEFVNVAGVVALQALFTRRSGFSGSALFSALVLDTVAVATVVAIIVFLK
ncbi:MAG: hypothetical protein AAFX94_02180 [Myxococcota bacterium]